MRPTRWILAIALVMLTIYGGDALARAGSGGSRGSRSSSAPVRPVPTSPTTPTSPSRQLSTPATPAPAPQPSRGWMGGLMGGLAGFALGGLLGSMLFGGLGHGLGGGIGLLEILLIGGGLFLLFRFLSARRAAEQPAYAGAGGSYAGGSSYAETPAVPATAGAATAGAAAAVASDLDRGLNHIRSMDPTFDPGFISDGARALFGDVQRAITARDMSAVSSRLTSRMYTELTQQCDHLRAARQTNRMEAINLRTVEVSEAWQESGQDFVTVYLAGSLVDYTVDDTTGTVVAGAPAPQEFEEFWTFTRPVGPNPWRLSAIQSA